MYVSYFHSDKLSISAGYFDALVTGSCSLCVTSVEFSRPLAQILDPIHKCCRSDLPTAANVNFRSFGKFRCTVW